MQVSKNTLRDNMTRTAQTLTIRRVKHLPGVQVESSGDMLERNKSNTYPVRRSTNGPVVKCSHAVQLFHAKQRGGGEGRGGDSQRWMWSV